MTGRSGVLHGALKQVGDFANVVNLVNLVNMVKLGDAIAFKSLIFPRVPSSSLGSLDLPLQSLSGAATVKRDAFRDLPQLSTIFRSAWKLVDAE